MSIIPLIGGLVGGAATVVGGGMSMVGGAMSLAGGLLHAGSTITSIGASAVGGLASAAGGMLGGGESGNVQRGGEGGGERVYGAERFGSKNNTAKTPGAGRQATVVPQTSMAGSQSTALASSEGTSPQEVLMSIFKSMQQSLISIDNTLRSMLGVDTATLAMEKKSDTQDKLNAQDTDKEKGPGFFSRVGSKAKGAVKRIMPSSGGAMSKALKLVGLGAMIALFNKYQDQITSAIAKVIGYFLDLEKEFDKGGFTGVFNKISGDLSALGEKIMPVLKAFWNDTVMPMLKEFFSWALTTAKDIVFPGSTKDPTKTAEQIAAEDVKIVDTQKTVQDEEGNLGEKFDVATGNVFDKKILKMKKLTRDTKGKITWSENLGAFNSSVSKEDKAAANPIVNGVEFTGPDKLKKAVEAAKKAPDTDFLAQQILGKSFNLGVDKGYSDKIDKEKEIGERQSQRFRFGEGSFGSIGSDKGTYNVNEAIIMLRSEIQKDFKAMAKGDFDYGIFGESRGTRVKENQEKIKALGGKVNDYSKDAFDADNDKFISRNTKMLNQRTKENKVLLDKQAGGGNITTVAPITNNQTNVSNNTQGQSRHPRARAIAEDNLAESRYTDN